MKQIFTIIAFEIIFTSFIIMTVDFVQNPTQYDTVAKYHISIESR